MNAYHQSHYISEYAYSPIYQNTYSEYYPIGEAKFASMIQELKQAKHYIFLEYFIIREGKMWNTILEILKEKPEEPQAAGEQLVFRQVIYEHAPETGCWYPACHAGDFFRKGEILGEIRDYFGNTVYSCKALADGMILYQTASLAVLKDGPMTAYGVLPEQKKTEGETLPE